MLKFENCWYKPGTIGYWETSSLLALLSHQISELLLEAELKGIQMNLGLNPSPAFISYVMIGKLLNFSGLTFFFCKRIPNKFGEMKQDTFVNIQTLPGT